MNEVTIVSTIKVWDRKEITDPEIINMIQEAEQAAILAHAPYSNFKVGVAIKMSGGAIVRGANQENASYPICICAEPITMGSAKTQYPEQNIEKMFIAVPSSDSPISPCGMCRQSILEYENRQNAPIQIYLIGVEEIIQIDGIKSILPLAFDGRKLV